MLLRLAILVLLVGAIASTLPSALDEPERRVVDWRPGETDVARVVADVGPIVRHPVDPPTAPELELLAAASTRRPLFAARPHEPPALSVSPPERSIAGRAAALAFTLHGAPGDTLRLRVRDDAGPVDSATVIVGTDGTVRGGLRVRPTREGWHRWTVEAGPNTAVTGDMVRPGSPTRVLIAAGPATWESRDVARALEEAGAEIELIQPLGRGLDVGDATASTDASASAIANRDVVFVMPGAELAETSIQALVEHTTRGGGVLVYPGSAAAAAFGITASGPGGAAGTEMQWSVPPELVALPTPRFDLQFTPITESPGAFVAARAGDAPVLMLFGRGRGRVAAIGMAETWRWRIEDGRIDEHRSFWRALADWLATGRDSLIIRTASRVVAPGEIVDVHAAADIETLWHMTPSDTTPVLMRPAPSGGAAGRFLADYPGVHGLTSAEQSAPNAGVFADVNSPAPDDAWARLVFIARRSGGLLVNPDSVEVSMRAAAMPARRGWTLPLLVLALVLALTEWTGRRVRGMP